MNGLFNQIVFIPEAYRLEKIDMTDRLLSCIIHVAVCENVGISFIS